MPDDEVLRIAESRLGRVLRGKYRLDRILGVGGMATVYACTHRNRKRFAVKMLHPELSTRETIRARFLREGYVANSVEHPGAVNVLDDDVAEDGSAFLVMELLDGASLEEMRTTMGGKVPLPLVVSIGDALLDVLAAAHARGIVHRDIKPANLFLTSDGALKVLDFGIARLRDETASGATATGLAMGTPAYMAPELAMAKASEVDAQTDLWAVGATLFTLASGALVHEGENAQQIMIAAATKPARSLRAVTPDVPEPIAAVVDRALALARKDRWAGAAVMREALAEASVRALGTPPGPLPRTHRPVSSGSAAAGSDAFDSTVSIASAGDAGTPRPPGGATAGGVSRTSRSARPPGRHGRRRAIAVSGVLGLAVAGGLALRHAAHAPRTIHCGEVVVRRDGPRCALPLSEDLAATRFRRSRLTEVDGRVTAIEKHAYVEWPPQIAVTQTTIVRAADGAVTEMIERGDHEVVNEWQKWSEGGQRVDFVDVDGVSPRTWGNTHITTIRREFDAQGRVVAERYYGPSGKPRPAERGVYGHAYVYGRGDKIVRDTMLGADGAPSPDDDGRAVVVVDDDGLPGARQTRYLDAQGKPVRVDGIFRKQTDWTEAGEPASWKYFGPGDEPVVSLDGGEHEKRVAWDPVRRTREIRTFDEKGAPATSRRDLYAIVRLTFDARGKELLSEYLDARGNPVVIRNDAAKFGTTWNEAGDPVEYAFFDPGGAPMQGRSGFARQVNVWDGHGNLVQHAHYDETGRPEEGVDDGPMSQSQHDARGLVTVSTSFTVDGRPVAGRTGVWSKRFLYDGRRNEIEESYFGVDGKRTVDVDGVSVRRWTYDADDDLVESSYLDASDAPVVYRGACASERSRYDDFGRTIEESCLDLRGRPTPGKDGWALARYVHDRDGNLIDEAYFGPRGEPAARNGGYARKHSEYDVRGRVVRVTLFDASGAPAAGDEGWAVEATTWDDRGFDTRIDHLDAQARPVLTAAGYAARTRVRDGRGNLVEETSLGVDGKPVAPPGDGYATKKTRYDQRSLAVEEALFGVDGRPVAGKEGWAVRQLVYDEPGNLMVETFLGVDGAPTLLLGRPYASQRWEYNGRHRSIETRCYGPNDAPARCAEGAEIVRYERDPWGKPLKTSYFDGSGAPVATSEGKMVVVTRYDDGGRPVEERDLDAAGQPRLAKDGCAGQRWRYDPHGRRVEEVCVGLDGKPALTSEGWAIRNTGYDARGNVVEQSTHDASGALHADTDGVARTRARFGERNELLERSIFDAQDRPVRNPWGVSVWRYTYDEGGRQMEQQTFDEKGRPVKPKKM